MTEAPLAHFRRHRFPAEIIAHAVWLYYRFPLSFRDIEDLLAERGINVSFQTVSEWAAKFGLKFAHLLRHRSRGHFSDKWQLDEMVVTIKGKKYWLWRAVDANGYVLDALLQSRRNKAAALKLMRKLRFCRKLLRRPHGRLSLGTFMLQGQRIVEMWADRCLRIGACGSCEQLRSHLMSPRQTGRI